MTSLSGDSRALDTASSNDVAVAISDEQHVMVVDPAWLTDIVRSVLTHEGVDSAEISIALVDDATIHDVNREFLAHDYPTDVISFLLSASGSPEGQDAHVASDEVTSPVEIDGDVIISTQTAKRVAGEVGCDAMHELALYLVHGLLHLCGYDDQADEDRQQMRLQERSHLQKLGIRSHYVN